MKPSEIPKPDIVQWAMGVSVIAVTLSAGIVGYAMGRLQEVDALERKVETLQIQYAIVKAELDQLEGELQ